MVTPVREVAELDRDFWAEGIATFGQYVSPWLLLVDAGRYHATVHRIDALSPSVLAACHTPVVSGPFVADAIELTRRTPTMTVPAPPDQTVLEQIQRSLACVA